MTLAMRRARFTSQHVYEVRPRRDKRGFDLISDALHTVACGMNKRRMQSATRSFTAGHITL
jgi:hypothetical protein